MLPGICITVKIRTSTFARNPENLFGIYCLKWEACSSNKKMGVNVVTVNFRGIVGVLAVAFSGACASMCVVAETAQASRPLYVSAPLRAARVPLQSGAELITYFEKLPDEAGTKVGRNEIPLLAVLKDTLNGSDDSNDRLRQVWIFTYSRPSIFQRIAGGIPFLYRRTGMEGNASAQAPRPVLDMGAPSRGTWSGVALTGVQSHILDPVGVITRLTTHSYGGNLGEYRKTHLWEVLDVLASLTGDADGSGGLNLDEMQALQARLELKGHLLGGLVGDEYLPRAYAKYLTRRTENRGHNWELLRQAAEENGLYFQPLRLADLPVSFALVWVAQPDVASGVARHFDAQFLNIANPFQSERLQNWTGYSEIWHRNEQGVPVTPDATGARPVRMIPLALYSLDYPRVPFQLVDFRSSGRPRRSEIARKLADDVTTGVLGMTEFGNWSYLALKSSWFFVHERHGGATNRSARRRAFVQLRHALGADGTMPPALRRELLARVAKLDLNPVDHSWNDEVRNAWRQYDALMAYAQAPGGLTRDVEANRSDEMRTALHGAGKRTLFRMASLGTFGWYRHREILTSELMTQLAETRRAAALKRQGEAVEDPIVAAVPNRTSPASAVKAGGGSGQ